MPGRTVLHGQHNAPVHHQRGPVPEPQVPDEVRPEQDAPEGDIENRIRVAAVDSHEPAAEPHVLESKYRSSGPIRLGGRRKEGKNPELKHTRRWC